LLAVEHEDEKVEVTATNLIADYYDDIETEELVHLP